MQEDHSEARLSPILFLCHLFLALAGGGFLLTHNLPIVTSLSAAALLPLVALPVLMWRGKDEIARSIFYSTFFVFLTGFSFFICLRPLFYDGLGILLGFANSYK